MRHWYLFLLIPLTAPAWASTIQVGQPLPDLAIAELGELLLEEDEFRYQPWRASRQPDEKVHVLQYMAGRMSARNQNRAFTDRLEKALPYRGYHVTTVINLDDALWGTSSFVLGEVKASKRKYPASTIVMDENGVGLETWRLQPKNSNIVVTDASGTVLYFKQGPMSDEEIEATLKLIEQHIGDPGS